MNESRLDDWEAMQIKGILDAEINTNNKVEIKIGEGETSLTKWLIEQYELQAKRYIKSLTH